MYQSFIQVNKTGHFNNLAYFAETDITQFFRLDNSNRNLSKDMTSLNEPLERLSIDFPTGLVWDISRQSTQLTKKIDSFRSSFIKENSPSSFYLLFKSFF